MAKKIKKKNLDNRNYEVINVFNNGNNVFWQHVIFVSMQNFAHIYFPL